MGIYKKIRTILTVVFCLMITVLVNYKVYALEENVLKDIGKNIYVDKYEVTKGEDLIITIDPGKNLKDLSEEANICYMNEDVERQITLNLENGKYKGILKIDDFYAQGTWKVSFVIIGDKENNVAIVYNSKIHGDFGEDLSSANFIISSNPREQVIKFDKPYINSIIAITKRNLENKLSNAESIEERSNIISRFGSIPLKAEGREGKLVIALDSEIIEALKRNTLGVKVVFNDFQINLDYGGIEKLKDGEGLKIIKSKINSNKLLDKIDNGKKSVSKIHTFNIVKVCKNAQENKLDIRGNVTIGIKLSPDVLNRVKKENLKIGLYDKNASKWNTINSFYSDESNLILGTVH